MRCQLPIIAILAAILFPVFAKAREKARQSSCSSNLKQIGIAVMQYCQDYDETYPKNEPHQSPETVTNAHWNGFIYPYTKNAQLYKCPSWQPSLGYSVNSHVSGWASGVTMALMTAPAEVIYTGDTCPTNKYTLNSPSSTTNNPDRIFFAPYETTTYTWCPPHERHNEGFNATFCDGHVKWMRADQTYKGTTSGSWTMWDYDNKI